MGVIETLIFYACVGLATAAAMAVAADEDPRRAGLLFVPRVIFWPFFAPGLFGGAMERERAAPRKTPDGDVATLERELVDALQRLEGVAEEVLTPEIERVHDLASVLARMKGRIREMEAMMQSREFDASDVRDALHQLDSGDPRRGSLESRQRSIERLHTMHERARMEYDKVVLQLQELHSKILLLRFADDPEDEIVELMRDISSSVEGVCAGAFAD